VARWLAGDVPEWVAGLCFLVFLPALMVFVQIWVHRRFPRLRSGESNDVAGIMLSAAVVAYSVAVGLCVVTLWGKVDEAYGATEAEATNLLALAGGSGVFGTEVQEQIRTGVIAYNTDVLDHWPQRIAGNASDAVRQDLSVLVTTVGALRPETDAQRAFVDDAVVRLGRADELQAASIRLAQEQQLPGVLWIAVLGGSVIVLALSLTCGVRDSAMRGILLAGLTATVGINLFLVVELNYPFYGDIAIGPDSYRDVITTLTQTR
jgi:hypothetical protein